MTTYALGEEGGSDGLTTTKAVNEEGGGATNITYAVGEGGEGLNLTDAQKKRIKEILGEIDTNNMTTYALGEEGGSDGLKLDDETKKKLKIIFDKYLKDGKLAAQAFDKLDGKTEAQIQKIFDDYIKNHKLTTLATNEEGG